MSFLYLLQFDGDITNDHAEFDDFATPTVVSGTPVYSASANGQAFEVGSAVINLGASWIDLGYNSNLNMQLQVDSDATDGVILACDELTTNKCVWAFLLTDNGTNIKYYSYLEEQTTAYQYALSVPAGNGMNNYNWEFVYGNAYRRVNGGSFAGGTFYAGFTTAWDNGRYVFQQRIGQSLYGNNPTTPLPILTAATGVHLDWISVNLENDGYVTATNTNTSIRTAPTVAASAFAVTPTPKQPVQAMATSIAGKLGSGGGGAVIVSQKEFWT